MHTWINYPKHYTTPPTMETQTTGREKSAYLDSADVLKKKKKKKKKKPTYAPQREKRTLKNGPVEDQNEAQERKLVLGAHGHRRRSRGRRSSRRRKRS